MLVLVACTSVQEPESVPVILEPVKEVVPVSQFVSEPVTRTVGVSDGRIFGLSEDNRLLRVDDGVVWELDYINGRLADIVGPSSVEFLYVQNRLSAVDLGAIKLDFVYNPKGNLIEVRGGKENLYFNYDSKDRLRVVKRGVAGETDIDYDNAGLIKYLTRGSVTTDLFYDDKGRVRNFDADDTKFIFGYWRDDKLISLSGKTFGGGLTVSYGPAYPAFEASVISPHDSSKFTAAYSDTLYTVVDEYLYCNYVRRLKDVLFDGISYAFFVNYFKGDIVDYLMMNFVCRVYEAS